MEKVRPWCGQPSDRGRLRNRTERWCVKTVRYGAALHRCVTAVHYGVLQHYVTTMHDGSALQYYVTVVRYADTLLCMCVRMCVCACVCVCMSPTQLYNIDTHLHGVDTQVSKRVDSATTSK